VRHRHSSDRERFRNEKTSGHDLRPASADRGVVPSFDSASGDADAGAVMSATANNDAAKTALRIETLVTHMLEVLA